MTILQIVSVNYFGADTLGGLVESLVGQSNPDWELMVVDNSRSATEVRKLTELAERDRRIAVAVAPSNLGYFGGAHWWLSQHPVGADWIAVCNADVVLDDTDFIAKLAAARDTALVVAPDITALPAGHSQNPYLEIRPSARHMLVRRLAFSTRPTSWMAFRVARARKRPGSAEGHALAKNIYAPHGSFILFRRRFFDEGGVLVHPPFLYYEEVTVAECALRLGGCVRYEPSLKVIHAEHQATGKSSRGVFLAQREAAVYAHRLIRQSRTA